VQPHPRSEWLETDGLGGFASGTAGLIRTRRYHALLLTAVRPPTERFVLVNGFEAVVTTPAGEFAISSQEYAGGVIHPGGQGLIAAFEYEPWPRWRFALPDGTEVEQEIAAVHDRPVVMLAWRLVNPRHGVRLEIRLLLSGRPYHALHHENPAFRFEEERRGGAIVWRPYDGVPGIAAVANGAYERDPRWYRSFLYEEERARGLDHVEDLASPGRFEFDLSRGEASLVLAAGTAPAGAAADATALRAAERRRRAAFPGPLQRAADTYLVRRGAGRTIVAGYPWFTDWGRDTFIALRGLCLAAGRLEEARDILVEWAGTVSRGMLPNRFPDRDGDAPEFNAVDASLWYIVAVHDYLAAASAAGRSVSAATQETLHGAVDAILAGYAEGTRYGIRAAEDGLLAAGEPGVQLTWMDAKVVDWVVTPRAGKPVEVEALWINALRIGAVRSERWRALHDRALESFRARFPVPGAAHLHDVVDADHQAGRDDATFRPNQILAVGGLPYALLHGAPARALVDAVETRLLTPLGLRSLDPADPAYRPRYEGGVLERDGAYHQGTVWPWLIGPFVEAWVRVRGATPGAKREARARFVAPLLGHLGDAGLGHVSEIADGDPPHTPRGCPFQAWSMGELLRLSEETLAEEARPVARSRA
jgi:predicted glycogen debranching enzyme